MKRIKKNLHAQTLWFSLDTVAMLQTLAVVTKSGSTAETIRKALRLHHWWVTQEEQGHSVCLGVPDGILEIILSSEDKEGREAGQDVVLVQYTFLFTLAAGKELQQLAERTGSLSKDTTIRDALRKLAWCVGEAEKGHRLCVETPEGIREVKFPFIPGHD